LRVAHHQLNGVYVRALAATSEQRCSNPSARNSASANARRMSARSSDIVQRWPRPAGRCSSTKRTISVGKKILIETLRDIHDLATVPVVLIGMHGFRRKITHLQQLTGRIAQWVEFKAASIDDALLLARRTGRSEIAPELVRKLHETARGSVR
jgi:hypothetical protein